ncbi:MAG: 4-phosphoerythronate dehydrogenase [Kiritimatiellae bacterium]|nr:4-phosphoerythronate dehydrogenase [Kiritimatiellia bacterium]
MKIVCDTNMPLGRTLFGTLGTVTLVDGAHLTAEQVKDADVLMVRDTRITAELLEGSSVRFVGTAVTGTDHVDVAYLNRKGIRWVNAPRANGESVADYCLAALLEYAHTRHRTLAGATVALIGVGWIGSMVRTRCEGMGMRVLCCDPPRQRNAYDLEAQSFLPLKDVLAEADYIIPFVPLTREGDYATWHMLNAETLAQAKYGAVLINMARGAVCDTEALCVALREGSLGDAIIDVWEDEPNFSTELADLAFLATPHLAGHSYEGKVNGTIAVYHALCTYLGRSPSIEPILPPPIHPKVEINAHGKTDEEILWFLTQKLSMIVADHLNFQDIVHLPQAQRIRRFATQRRTYPYRRQYCATQINVAHGTPELLAKIKAVGFKVV